jgi:putative endonuclease
MPWFLYIVKCSDNSLYTGITTDISRRIKTHNSKKGAFYTKNKIPVKLVYHEDMPDRSEATRREKEIKRLTRQEKMQLFGIKAGKYKRKSGKRDLGA